MDIPAIRFLLFSHSSEYIIQMASFEVLHSAVWAVHLGDGSISSWGFLDYSFPKKDDDQMSKFSLGSATWPTKTPYIGCVAYGS